jgi:hypothetical protein
MTPCTTARQALAFVRRHGVVLASARGTAPRLTEAIVGEEIKGSWWAHPKSHRIYRILGAVTASDQVLVCRLIAGKITLVHRRLWPALVRLADRFTPAQLAQVRELHTASGRHAIHVVPFPEWVSAEVLTQAQSLAVQQALALLGAVVESSRQSASGSALPRPRSFVDNHDI